MKNKNHYQEAPEHYLLCYNTTCGKAKTCLHQLVACAGINKDAIVECVNPAVNEGENCTYYQQDHIVQMAYGMKQTFKKILASDITSMRSTLITYFGNGSYYARRNGEKAITPDEQEYISSVFRDYGYAEGATFDSYKDEVEW